MDDIIDEILARHNFRRGPILQELEPMGISLSEGFLKQLTYDETDPECYVIERILDRIEEARIANDRFLFIVGEKLLLFSDDYKKFSKPPFNLEMEVLDLWNERTDLTKYSSSVIPMMRGHKVIFFKNKLYSTTVDGRSVFLADQSGEDTFYARYFADIRTPVTYSILKTVNLKCGSVGDYLRHSVKYTNGETYELYVFPPRHDSEASALLRGRIALGQIGPSNSLPRLMLDVIEAEREKLAKRHQEEKTS